MTGPVFLFDGDCAFCSSSARWLIRHVPTEVPIMAWQLADLELLRVELHEVEVAVVLASPAGNTSGAAAIAELLSASSSRVWRLAGRTLDLPLVRSVAAVVYRWVAANRHRLPGGTPECALRT